MSPSPRRYVIPVSLILGCYLLIQAFLNVFLTQTNSLSVSKLMEDERAEILRQTVKFDLHEPIVLSKKTVPMTTRILPVTTKNDSSQIANVIEILRGTQQSMLVQKNRKRISLKNFTVVAAKVSPERNITMAPSTSHYLRKVTPSPTPYSAIINSYMRGGSSFVGRLLGFHPDSFYFYEPLNKFLLWEYFEAKSKLCHSNLCVCRNGKAFASAFMRHLVNVMHCKGFRDVTSPEITDFYSGKSWERFTKCFSAYKARFKRKIIDPPDHCLFEIQNHCTRFKHVIAKVLRLTLDNYDSILSQTIGIKIFHLFRDPRAIINSRLTTDWFPVNNIDEVKSNARCLCIRIKKDYYAGLKLAEQFPDRFMFLMYEDVVDNMHEKANNLYNVLGMRTIDEIGEDVFQEMASYGISTDHKLRDNSTDYTAWWRRTIDWNIMVEMNNYCEDVIELLGYTVFRTEEELRNLSISHIQKPYKFTIS